MGLSLFRASDNNPTPPNPDPKKFKILGITAVEHKSCIVIVEAFYPGCTTFEGKKVMVFRGDPKHFKGIDELDPHFTESNHLLARFPATNEGRRDAFAYASDKSDQLEP